MKTLGAIVLLLVGMFVSPIATAAGAVGVALLTRR